MNYSDNQRLCIAGITGGIGGALARLAHAEGWQVIGLARQPAKAEVLQQELPGLRVLPFEATDPSSFDTALTAASAELGGLDGYAHCVGSIYLRAAHQTSVEDWHKVLELNLHSAFYALRTLAPLMRKQRAGSLVFCSSVAAVRGLGNHEAIAAAKAGLSGLVRAAAATYASAGLRLNAVAPGLVDTPAAQALLGNEQARKISASMHPLGRVGSPDDIARLLLFLLRSENSWITGETFSVDGGMASLTLKPRA